MSKLAPLMSSVKMDWQTPDCVLDRVRRIGAIALDPCTTDENQCGAAEYLTPADDGLALPWRANGLVFVNPPYGRELPLWVEKCIAEAARGAEIVLLVPARPDTRWFSAALETCQALAFWRGRLKFRGAKDPAPFPSALFYWGPRRWEFKSAFQDVAHVNYEMHWTRKSFI